MKTVNYKETYDKIPLVIQIDDDAAEGLEEIIYFLNENIRIIDNLQYKERYHTPYHIEGLIYEGMEYASDEDMESDVARQQGNDYSTANKSIKADQKKLQKIWNNTPAPPF